MNPPAPTLQVLGVSKRYPGTLAVDLVDFAVQPGEVHALMGENGAGKSSLMKMLAGMFAFYTGNILINGKEVLLHSPAATQLTGRMVQPAEVAAAALYLAADESAMVTGSALMIDGGWSAGK